MQTLRQTNKELTEAIEAEKTTHLESKFNSELVQVWQAQTQYSIMLLNNFVAMSEKQKYISDRRFKNTISNIILQIMTV